MGAPINDSPVVLHRKADEEEDRPSVIDEETQDLLGKKDLVFNCPSDAEDDDANYSLEVIFV